MRQALILLGLLTLASCTGTALAWDRDNNTSAFGKQPQRQEQDRRNSWDKQQDAYNKTGVDTYENGQATRHREEQRQARERQGYGGSQYGQKEWSNFADPYCKGLYGC